MKLENHERESITYFGKPFTEIHQWLDQYAGTPKYRMRHRKILHHEQGIKKVIELFGEKAGKVARRHIISDLEEEGWREGVDKFPQNEKEYIAMGFF